MSEETFDRLCMLPNGWLVKTINDITIRVGSGVTPTGGSEVYSDSGVIFVRSQNVTNSGLLLDDVAFIDTLTHEKMRSSELLPFDVLLNITGASIGRCCVFPQEIGSANVNQHVCTIRLKSPNYMEAKFLALLFVSPLGQNQIFRLNAGGNREGLNYQQIRSMCFSFPPIPQQRKIAKILTTVDNLIEKTEALIAKYQSIKQGMMHDLFTRGVDAKGKLRPPQSVAPELYKQSELGWIPKEWKISSVDKELLKIESGKSPNCQDIPANTGEWGVLKVSAIQPDGFLSMENKMVANNLQINPKFEVKEGDLIITRANTYELVGSVCLVKEPQKKLMLCDKTLRLVFDLEKNDLLFIYFLLQQPSFRHHIENHATGTSGSMKNISQSSIRKALIAIAPKVEQTFIQEKINECQLIVISENRNKEKLQRIKTALMQDLLTGKVKVTPDEIEKKLAHV